MGQSRIKDFDLEDFRNLLKQWCLDYGQYSEVAGNLIVAVAVVLFISYQTLTLLSLGNRAKELKRQEMKQRKEVSDKCVGSEEHLVEHHKHVVASGKVSLHIISLDDEESLRASQFFYERMKIRRSIRHFSDRSVPMKVILNIVKTAGTAPSAFGAQPWIFCVIMRDELRLCIQQIVEDEHRKNYLSRLGAELSEDVSFLDSSWNRPYLSEAPCLIAVCHSIYHDEDRVLQLNETSTAISVGILLAAIQLAGLHTVVTSPLTAGPILSKLLHRPDNEALFLLLPIGYPPEDATVPDLPRKPLENIVKLY